MALLTVRKESALAEAGNSALTSTIFHGFAGNFLLVRTPSYLAFFTYTASAKIWCLPCKWRMVIVSAEFDGKQSHDIGPLDAQLAQSHLVSETS